MRILPVDPRGEFTAGARSCACIGYFDGLHRGHRRLLDETVKAANASGTETAVITFDRDPLEILSGKAQKQILSRESLFGKLEEYGIDIVYLIPFDRDTAALSDGLFLRRFLYRLDLETLVCGYDFRYGAGGKGSAAVLLEAKDRPFAVKVVDPVCEDGRKISSTAVKRFLERGEIGNANLYLGYTYSLEGEVIRGLSNGRKLGFPTVNLRADPALCLPAPGVYAGFADTGGKRYPAMINLGSNPTVAAQLETHFEAHLLGYEGDLYGERIRLYFTEYLRKEIRFGDLGALKEQLEEDRKRVEGSRETVRGF